MSSLQYLGIMIYVMSSLPSTVPVNSMVKPLSINWDSNILKSNDNFHLGKNVCIKKETVRMPVKSRQTYMKPVYQTYVYSCMRHAQLQLCSGARVVHQVAYRDTVQEKEETRSINSCCSGWTQLSPDDNDCLQPVCTTGCYNGGTCVAPDECRCPSGWRGKNCQKDIDECSKKPNPCGASKCVNTAGGYSCECSQGFTLSADGKSCDFCLTCVPEYQEMTANYGKILNRVAELEKYTEFLEQNMTIMQQQHDTEVTSLRQNISSLSASLVDCKPPTKVLEQSVDKLPLESVDQQTLKHRRANSVPHDAFLYDNNDDNDIVPSHLRSPSLRSSNEEVGEFADNRNYLTESAWDRLTSLSEQISLLEERLGFCQCKPR